MISVNEAFKKFKGRLELSTPESKDASTKQQDAREFLKGKVDLEDSFLTGSYARYTKTRPLKDVDIFVVLGPKETHWKTKGCSEVLAHFEKILKPKYGEKNVSAGRRAVQIRFHDDEADNDENTNDVFSIDIVPAFKIPEGYLIPCSVSGWLKTDPTVHADKATKANQAFSDEWKPVVKMLKKWNENHGKPIKPSFLIEVMALDILKPPFSGNYLPELKLFYAAAYSRAGEVWKDPAGLGHPVSEQMTSEKVEAAKKKLKHAELYIQKVVLQISQGKNGEALRTLRDDVFGPKFPLS